MSLKNNKSSIINNKYSLTIAWLYPDLMNTYGDRGNIMVFQKRLEWRGIDVQVHEVSIHDSYSIIHNSDLIFMGGAQDTQQELVVRDLIKQKGKILKEKIENNTPGLYICGAYQFLGKYYITADGSKLPGLDVFPLHTENKGKGTRLIGNVIASPNTLHFDEMEPIVGFENHGGRTYLEDEGTALGVIEKGYGNNGEDGTEGIVYKNSIGTYFHGPLLPKNPAIADWLISKALEQKYGEILGIKPLDDLLEENARKQTTNLRLS